ncbi:hypothetical protein D9615_008717 [Tricholomella constricta]|uniref:G domain-containing protein n=1 Tax=Tricholomella constricta TaxID=117010 RepID=A0A8H5H7W8_9AGAR|nr:hypothetical protein D9615_008717 [Tricholomella constricta]
MSSTGVGKSSLINQAFGVNQALVEHNKRGQADINQEIFSQENDMFVLHDSLGFEPGEKTNFQIAKDFIKERNEMPQIKDKLHAIWLCFEIPTAGGRVIETGTEDFLSAKVEGELGDVPVIGVFTKYDKLVNSEMFSLASNRQIAHSSLVNLAEEAAEHALQNKCFGPFKECLRGRDVPYVKVSTNPKYPDSKATLEALVSLTQDLVVGYIRDAGLVTGMAQRASPDVSIKTSVEVGKRRKTLQQCLDVIHTDIVTVWNFNDPNKYLYCEAFRQMSYEIVDKSSKNTSPRGRTYLASGLSIVGTLAGVLSALAGPAAPIVVPIAATVVVIVWLREVYKESRITLQRLMTYIVQLTLIMQIIFWLQVVLEMEDREISRRIIKLAVKTYTQSPEKEKIEFEIKNFADKANMTDPDAAFNKIDAMLKESRINSRAGLEEQNLATRFDPAAEDEQWDYLEAN